MYIRREIVSHLRELERYFPVLSITGPRQAGKMTLLKHLYPDYQYLSLENPDLRQRAQEDPRGFLRKYNRRVIFDEAQRVPALFSYVQTLVDEEWYKKEEMKNIVTDIRTLDDFSIVFLSLILDPPKEAFRCYNDRQSRPSFWDY